jgi:hypothetical protein
MDELIDYEDDKEEARSSEETDALEVTSTFPAELKSERLHPSP